MQVDIAQFIEYLTSEKDSSKNTLAAYSTDLTQFVDFLKGSVSNQGDTIKIDWSTVTNDTMQGYLKYLEGNDYASSTIARKIAAVKSYFHYVIMSGILDNDPTSKLNAPKVEKSTPQLIGHKDIALLLAAPTSKYNPTAQRDKALLEVLYSTGLRVTELINLNVDKYNSNQKTITCGIRHERTIPIHVDAAAHLDKYIADGRTKLWNSSDEHAMFLNHRGQRLTRQGLWLIIKRYAKQSGINKKITPHSLRHSFAAHLLDSGVEVEDIQTRLGHANLSTTQTYRRSISDMSEVVVDGKVIKK